MPDKNPFIKKWMVKNKRDRSTALFLCSLFPISQLKVKTPYRWTQPFVATTYAAWYGDICTLTQPLTIEGKINRRWRMNWCERKLPLERFYYLLRDFRHRCCVNNSIYRKRHRERESAASGKKYIGNINIAYIESTSKKKTNLRLSHDNSTFSNQHTTETAQWSCIARSDEEELTKCCRWCNLFENEESSLDHSFIQASILNNISINMKLSWNMKRRFRLENFGQHEPTLKEIK